MKKPMIIIALILFAGITYGQTLQKGGVIAVHHMKVTLAPGVTMDQFMDFMTSKSIPEMNKEFEGVKFFALEGDRGEGADGVAFLVYCESVEVRNKYWPEAESQSEEYMAILQKLQPLMEEQNKLGTYTRVYTEWVIK
jgi:hypothetical protein